MFKTHLMTNIRKTISRTMTVLTGTATFVTLYSWHQSIKKSLFIRSKFDQLLLENKELQKQITDLQTLKISDQNKVIESILDKYNSQLELSSNRILRKIELIKNLKEDKQNSLDLEQLNSQSEVINKEVENFSNILNNIINEISKNNSNNFIRENFIALIKDFITNWNNMLTQLTLEQTICLGNLVSSVFILLCILNILYIMYSNFLLDYFNLETKFPKLSRLFKIRVHFRRYYLILNFLIIIITLSVLIYLNFVSFLILVK